MEEIKKNISMNIAKYRKSAGLSQKDLADLLGSKNTTVSGWERGANMPDVETLFRICNILNVSIVQIYGCDSVGSGSSISVSGIERDIVLSYRKADDIGQAVVLRSLGIDPCCSIKGDFGKMA